MKLRPGETYYRGLDFAPGPLGLDERFGLVLRNGGAAAGVGVDFEPVAGLPPGNFVAVLPVPAGWSPGDVVQVCCVGLYGGLARVVWLPPVRLSA